MAPPVTIAQWVAWTFTFTTVTGMRQGEILRATWGHVHDQHIHLPLTKNGDMRDVPLAPVARTLLGLLERGEAGAAVVPVNAGTLGVYFRKARDEAGCPDLRFHDSRREATTVMARKVGDAATLARIIGHKDLRSLMVYFRPDVEELADLLG